MARLLSLASWALALGLPALCIAGAKSNMNACVWYPVDPMKPFQVNFTAGSSIDDCMVSTGSDAVAKVSAKGLTCASLGEVQEKRSGGCHFDSSYWGTSYVTDNGESGATGSQWSDSLDEATIQLQSQSAGTNVCAAKAKCDASSQTWDYDNTANLWIVFQPGYHNNAEEPDRLVVQKPEM